MLLNWHTIDACFLSSIFHIRSSFTFFIACLGAFILVISLEFLRRFQREFDRYLRKRNEFLQAKTYVLPEETEEKLLDKGTVEQTRQKKVVVVLEQLLRGLIHVVQFSVSYCIMLLFMYSNGTYPCISLLLPGMLTTGRVHHNIHFSWCSGRICSFHSGYFVFLPRYQVSLPPFDRMIYSQQW